MSVRTAIAAVVGILSCGSVFLAVPANGQGVVSGPVGPSGPVVTNDVRTQEIGASTGLDSTAQSAQQRRSLETRMRTFEQAKGRPVDLRSMYGYDREAFQEASGDAIERLEAEAADELGAHWLDPDKPILNVGLVGEAPKARAILATSGVAVQTIPMATTLKDRVALVAKLNKLDVGFAHNWDTANHVQYTVDPALLAKDSRGVAEKLGDVLGLDETRVQKLADQLAVLPPFEYPDGELKGVTVGPLAVLAFRSEFRPTALSGGLSLQNKDGQNACTSGFAMRRISSGARLMATAGHCSDIDLYRNGRKLPWAETRAAWGEDWGFLQTPAPVGPSIGQVYVTATWQLHIAGPWRSRHGESGRCFKGLRSGYVCSTVTKGACGFAAMKAVSRPGDSGGPVIYPYGEILAVGIIAGECRRPNGEVVGAYTPIGLLERAGSTAAKFAVLTD